MGKKAYEEYIKNKKNKMNQFHLPWDQLSCIEQEIWENVVEVIIRTPPPISTDNSNITPYDSMR